MVARASFMALLHLAVLAPSWYRTTMVELVDLEILVETVADMGDPVAHVMQEAVAAVQGPMAWT